MINKETIELASAGKYSEFSNIIVDELRNKLADNEAIQAYSAKTNEIERKKSLYSSIVNQE